MGSGHVTNHEKTEQHTTRPLSVMNSRSVYIYPFLLPRYWSLQMSHVRTISQLSHVSEITRSCSKEHLCPFQSWTLQMELSPSLLDSVPTALHV